MKKFSLLALVAVMVMAFAGAAFAASPIANVAAISSDAKSSASENNGAIILNATNLYYIEDDANPATTAAIALNFVTTPLTGDGGSSGEDLLYALLNDTELKSITDIGSSQVSTGEIAGFSNQIFEINDFAVKNIKSLNRLAFVKNGETVTKATELDPKTASVDLTITPVEVKIDDTGIPAIVVVSGDKLDDQVITFDFTVLGTTAVISADNPAEAKVVVMGGVADTAWDYSSPTGTKIEDSWLDIDTDSGIQAKYDSKAGVLHVATASDGAKKAGSYEIVVLTTDHTVVDEQVKSGKTKIKPAGMQKDMVLATVKITVLPEVTKSADIVLGSLEFEEGKATSSVRINTNIIKFGVSNDIASGNAVYLVKRNDNTGVSLAACTLFDDRKAPDGVGVYVDVELPISYLNKLTSNDKTLSVAVAAGSDPEFSNTTALTNALPINITDGTTPPTPPTPPAPAPANAEVKAVTSVDITLATITVGIVPASADKATAAIVGDKYTVSYEFDDTTGAQAPVSVHVTDLGPIAQLLSDQKVAIMVKNPTTTGAYDCFVATQQADLTVAGYIPASYFTKVPTAADTYTADVYLVTYKEMTNTNTGGGSSGGCEMGFGLAAVAGLAALVLRKRSK